ncbi:MAG: AAA family ATPase [Myxococcales bacterium]|nr:AAA family ATPase [Myxococcales bacterium]
MEPFINVDLGPTTTFAVEVEREPSSERLQGRPLYVEIRSDRQIAVRRKQGWVDLIFPDPKARAAARRRVDEARTLIARLQLGDHFQRGDRLAGQLRLTAVQRSIVHLREPLVVAVKPNASGGELGLILDQLSNKPNLLAAEAWPGGPQGPVMAIRNEVLPSGKAPRIDLLTTDGRILSGVLEKGESGVRVLIETVARSKAEDRWGAVGLIRPEQGLLVTPSDEAGAWMSKESAPALSLPTSAVIDAWIRYHELERLDEEETLRRRAEPIAFDEWEDHKLGGRVRLSTEPDIFNAWFDERGQIRSNQRVSQAIELLDENREVLAEGELAHLERAEPRAGRAWAVLRLRERRNAAQVAQRGLVVAVADKGQTIQARRREAAAAKLATGDLPNFRLAECLVMPEQALPPERKSLGALSEPAPNSQQQQALKMALGCRDLIAIQGPPGTGKTRVLVEVVRSLHRGRAPEDGPIRVLLSAPQNDATGHLVDAFVETQGEGVEITVDYWTKSELRNEALNGERRQGTLAAKALISAAEQDPDFEAFRDLDELECRLGELSLAVRQAEPDEHVEVLGKVSTLLASRPRFRRLVDGAPAVDELVAKPKGPEPSVSSPESVRFEPLRQILGESLTESSARRLVAAVEVLAEPNEPLAVQAGRLAALLRRDLASGRRLERHEHRWGALKEQLPKIATESEAALDDPVVTPSVRLLGWLEEVRAQVWQALADLPPTLALARWRLGRALERRPMAWSHLLREYASVAAATCQRAAVLDDDAQFDLVIVDEAGRTSPLDLLIPLTKAKAAVLIGDQNQLPPTVEERLHAQLEAVVEVPIDLRQRSFFAELYDRLPHSNRIMLETQYRMHETIGQLVSDLFYEGRLRSYWTGDRAKLRLPDLGWFQNRPLVWVDVGQRINQRVAHEANAAEQAVVGELLEDLECALDLGLVEPGTRLVGVITFYSEQRRALEALVRARPRVADLVTVGTVDSFQGKEFPMVVLSTVRHDPGHGRVGFLRLPSRINVAFSRAQRQLIVLGSEATMVPRAHDREAGSPFLAETAARCRADREDTLFLDANALGLRSRRSSS